MARGCVERGERISALSLVSKRWPSRHARRDQQCLARLAYHFSGLTDRFFQLLRVGQLPFVTSPCCSDLFEAQSIRVPLHPSVYMQYDMFRLLLYR